MNPIRYIKDYQSLTSNDIFISSFPKSGNTRFRMAMAKYFSLLSTSNIKFSYDFVNSLLPEMGKGNISSARKKMSSLGLNNDQLLVKSHLPFNQLKHLYKKCKIIYIIRPEPVTIMSFYDYSLARNIIDNNTSFSTFLRAKKTGIESLVKSYKSYKDAEAIINYNDLMKDDLHSIFQALEKIEFNYDPEILKKSILATRREHTALIKNSLDKDSYNFAAKKTRSIDNYFSSEDKIYYNQVVADTIFTQI